MSASNCQGAIGCRRRAARHPRFSGEAEGEKVIECVRRDVVTTRQDSSRASSGMACAIVSWCLGEPCVASVGEDLGS